MDKQYRLFYCGIEIGRIRQKDEDFPKIFGVFYPHPERKQDPVSDQVQRYIAYCITADELMQEGEEGWEKFVAENEYQFLNLIETNHWYLLDEDKIEPILVPFFCRDNGIVWRWNTGSEIRI